MTTFENAQLTNVSANLKSGEITLTAKIRLDDEGMRKAQALKPYLNAKIGRLVIEITSMQGELPLPDKDRKA